LITKRLLFHLPLLPLSLLLACDVIQLPPEDWKFWKKGEGEKEVRERGRETGREEG